MNHPKILLDVPAIRMINSHHLEKGILRKERTTVMFMSKFTIILSAASPAGAVDSRSASVRR